MILPDPVLTAAILAIDPGGLAVRLRMRVGPAREAWLALLRALLPADRPTRRCPASIDDDRLLGGLDLAATLANGARSIAPGLLAETDRGIVVLPMAERITAGLAARLAGVLDTARIGLVALDEGTEDDPPLPSALLDRLAITLSPDDALPIPPPDLADQVADALLRLPRVRTDDALCTAFCRTALLAGIESLRAPLLALRVARIVAALSGHDAVDDQDAAIAARLVLAPRATRLPEMPADTPEQTNDPSDTPDPGPDPGPEPDPNPGPTDQDGPAPDPSDAEERAGDLADTVIQAVRPPCRPICWPGCASRAPSDCRPPAIPAAVSKPAARAGAPHRRAAVRSVSARRPVARPARRAGHPDRSPTLADDPRPQRRRPRGADQARRFPYHPLRAAHPPDHHLRRRRLRLLRLRPSRPGQGLRRPCCWRTATRAGTRSRWSRSAAPPPR